MTYLDPPAAAARRQNLLDRWVEDLVGWGCPLDQAASRAQLLLDRALDHGYALPTVLEGAPLTGTGSTAQGRARARVIAFHTRAGCRCGGSSSLEVAASARALPPDQHPTGCPVRDAHDAGSARHEPAAAASAGVPGQQVPETGLRHGVTEGGTA